MKTIAERRVGSQISDDMHIGDLPPPVQGSIGAILIEAGRLSIENAEQITRSQRISNLRFGDAAVRLGILTPADVEFALSAQFDYPYLEEGLSAVSTKLVAAYRPFTTQVESLRALRSRLIVRWLKQANKQKVLAIVSSEPEEGRSFIAANLAIVFSQLGERTLLIDADLRNPRQELLFGVDNRYGLSGILSGRSGMEAVQKIPSLIDLSVLPAGPTPPNPQELLGRPQFALMLNKFERDYDVVLLDTPPCDEYADAQTISMRAGSALIVVRKNHSHVKAFRKMVDNLAQSNIDLVGAVLNEFS